MESARESKGSLRSPIRLTHAAVMTTDLESSVEFYRDVLGLTVRIVEDDPIRRGRQRALLVDSDDHAIVEIIEMREMAHPSIPGRGGIHHVGFRLPRRDWHALRSRLDARNHRYEEVDGRLFVRDTDGLVLEIEQG